MSAPVSPEQLAALPPQIQSTRSAAESLTRGALAVSEPSRYLAEQAVQARKEARRVRGEIEEAISALDMAE